MREYAMFSMADAERYYFSDNKAYFATRIDTGAGGYGYRGDAAVTADDIASVKVVKPDTPVAKEISAQEKAKRLEELRKRNQSKLGGGSEGKAFRQSRKVESGFKFLGKRGKEAKAYSATRKSYRKTVNGKTVLVREAIKKKIGKWGGSLAGLVGGSSTAIGKGIIGTSKYIGRNPGKAGAILGAGAAGTGAAGYYLSGR